MNIKYRIVQTRQFKKDLKIIIRRKYNLSLINTLVDIISSGEDVPKIYYNHILSGNYVGLNECHITPDWLLIYKINEAESTLYLIRTGTHSDLF